MLHRLRDGERGRPLTEEDPAAISLENDGMATPGSALLALGGRTGRETGRGETCPEEVERDLTVFRPCGDDGSPRPEVAEAVENATGRGSGS